MTFEELQGFYLRIVCGYTIIGDPDNYYIVYDPRPKEQLLGKKYYDQTILRLISQGTPTEEQSMIILKDRRLWSTDQDLAVETLHKNLKNLNESLQGLEFKSVEKRSILLYIERTRHKLKELENIKNSLLVNSVEHLARYELFKFYAYLLTYNSDGGRMWRDWSEFQNSPNMLINQIVHESYASNDITETVIRKLARSEPWRSTWLAAVKTGNLFDRPTTEMTDYQRALVSWSLIYDNSYENPDCPSTEIMDNDILFDRWLESQVEKRNKETVSADNFIKNSRIKNANEIFIMADSQEDADKVYKLNDSVAMSSVRQREKKIIKDGTVKELDMPDIRKKLQIEANQMFVEKYKQ